MAITQFTPNFNFGGELGKSLGTGLGGILEGLGNQQAAQQKQQRSLQSLLQAGLSPEDARLIGSFNPQEQVKLLGQLWQRGGPGMNGNPEQAANTFTNGLPGEQGSSQPRSSFYNLPIRERREEEKLNLEREKLALKENAPYNASFEKRIQPATEFKTVLDQAKELFKQPGLQLGAVKSLIPNRLQNPQTQAFLAKLQELVTLKSQLGKGVASKQRLVQEALSKPQAWQNPEAIGYLLNSFDEALSPLFAEDEVRNQILQSNNGSQPRGFETKVKRWMHAIKDLPSASQFSEDAVIEANGKKFERAGNTWRPLE